MTDPNGQPVLTLTSPVMTALEVAIYLRLCDDGAAPKQCESAIRSVHGLVQGGQLRPIRPGREYVFSHDEVDRYIREVTEAFEPKRQRRLLTNGPEDVS